MTDKKYKYSDEILRDVVAKSFNMYDVMRNLGGSLTSGALRRHLMKRIKGLNLDLTHFKSPTVISADKSRLPASSILVYDRRAGRREQTANLRRALFEMGREERCGCGQGVEWNGKKLVLEIDHIDGNCINNVFDNLRFICPNCHSQINNRVALTRESQDGL